MTSRKGLVLISRLTLGVSHSILRHPAFSRALRTLTVVGWIAVPRRHGCAQTRPNATTVTLFNLQPALSWGVLIFQNRPALKEPMSIGWCGRPGKLQRVVVDSAVSGAGATLWRLTRRRGRESISYNKLRRTPNSNSRRGKYVCWQQEREGGWRASGGVRKADEGV
jgi:hypothetical protein